MTLQELIDFAEQMKRLHGDLEVYFKMNENRFVSVEEFAVYQDPSDELSIFVLQSDVVEQNHLRVVK